MSSPRFSAPDPLCCLSAVEAVAALRRGVVTAEDLIAAAQARIAAVDPLVNALPTLCPDRALARARGEGDATASLPARDPGAPGWLAGLPIAVKDMNPVAGVRCTYGSPLYADHVPAESDAVVRTLERRGALVIAKSNTPEFAAGAHTFNEVFGATRNPWDLSRSCGGSSGGSAVALATGMVWLATGSDLGGSLRIPAAFCGVVGLRPSPGRVAQGPGFDPFSPLSVEGPMGRSVADVALMLDAMTGADPTDPLASEAPATPFLAAALRPQAPRRVAWSADLGMGPVETGQISGAEAACRRFADLGAEVVAAGDLVLEDAPEGRGFALPEAGACFQVLRGLQFATSLGPLLETDRARLKPEVVWNIEQGLALSGDQIARANRQRAALVARMAALFRRVDLLVTPATAVPPFPIGQRTVEEIDGHKLATYIDWLALTFAITLTGCPALSLPCGVTAEGLPLGLQLVAPPRGEARLLAAAAALEEALDIRRLLPLPVTPGPAPMPETP